MTTRRAIITDPGAEVLHLPCPDLAPGQLGSREVNEAIDDLLRLVDTGWAFGAGLAAPQIGVPLRIAVFRSAAAPDAPLEVAINLHVTRRWGVRRVSEGCLSVPGRSEHTVRAERVSATWLSAAGHPRSFRRVAGDFAQVLEHECDHLDGVLFTERLA